jgi:hypothetical protein
LIEYFCLAFGIATVVWWWQMGLVKLLRYWADMMEKEQELWARRTVKDIERAFGRGSR